ncbi:branched-chain amino acid ABC transporter permease [Azospirillum brasilense]|uniref:branched-chain amino acid ABC transporter permease n=1 Tax=Azospirillum brasilense TaxID=192 RepID=UPI0019627773|nr:branched-chain amino acid ABC transporter permease [Azospirillum brasilense]
MALVAQQIVNGIVVGSTYALFALGFTLIFGVLHVLNLAHGAVFMWGAFTGLFAVTALGLPLAAAFAIAMLAAGLLSVLVDAVAFRPLRRRGSPEFAAIISSLGVAQILMSAAQIASDTQVQRFPFGTFPIVFYQVFGLRVSLQQIVIVGSVAVLVAALLAFLFATSFGRQIRAVAISERTASLLGVNPGAVHALTFFLCGALAGAAGVIIGIAFNSVHFLMGEPYLLRGFVVIVLGGLGSVAGAVIGGLLFGMIQTLSVAFLSSALSDAILFGLLFVILLLRPSGFFGTLRREIRVVRQ